MWDGDGEGGTRGPVLSYFPSEMKLDMFDASCVCVGEKFKANFSPRRNFLERRALAGHSAHTGSLKMN